jgi:NitT/TauT family transport system permease protein
VSTPPLRATIFGTLRNALIWLTLLAAWETAYRTVGWRPYVFPAPSHVLDATLGMLNVRTGFGEAISAHWPAAATPARGKADASIVASPLVIANLTSLTRLAIAFAISVMVGSALGLAMWRIRWLDELLGPAFLGLQTIPSVCWVPLAILTFQIDERAILFVTVMGSFFAVAIAMRDGLKGIPPVYARAGLMLGASGWRLYRYVLLPASLPALASSLRQGFGFAWRSLLGGELLIYVQRQGLGYLLHVGREFGDVAQVVAIMFVMVFIGMTADRLLFARIEKRVHRRFGLSPAT